MKKLINLLTRGRRAANSKSNREVKGQQNLQKVNSFRLESFQIFFITIVTLFSCFEWLTVQFLFF